MRNQHGTLTGYTKRKCRCRGCRRAWNTYTRHSRYQRANQVPDHVHGTVNGYSNYRCRCCKCYAAQSAARRAYLDAHPRVPKPKPARHPQPVKHAPKPVDPLAEFLADAAEANTNARMINRSTNV